MEPPKTILSALIVTPLLEVLLIRELPWVVKVASFSDRVIVTPAVAEMSFNANVTLPVVEVRLIEPVAVDSPLTRATVVTVSPFASTNITSPVVVLMARFVTWVEVSVTVTAPVATMAKSLTIIPPPPAP